MSKLTELANKFGSDKGSEIGAGHTYTEFYEPYFRQIKNANLAKKEKINILEIGVFKGASLQMLNEYFGKQNCEIYGLDIDLTQNEYEAKNVHLYTTDQNSLEELEKTAADNFADVKFDIIIDDGGHFYNQQFNTLLAYHKYLKTDGIYILEDLHTSIINPQEFNMSPLFFLMTKQQGGLLTVEQHAELLNCITDIIIYRRENMNSTYMNTSITSILKIDNNRSVYRVQQLPNETQMLAEQQISSSPAYETLPVNQGIELETSMNEVNVTI